MSQLQVLRCTLLRATSLSTRLLPHKSSVPDRSCPSPIPSILPRIPLASDTPIFPTTLIRLTMADDNTASSFLSHLQGGGGTQPQAPGAGQAHNHFHGHHHAGDHHHHVAAAAGHGHGHGHGHGDEDHWDADEYVTKPGM